MAILWVAPRGPRKQVICFLALRAAAIPNRFSQFHFQKQRSHLWEHGFRFQANLSSTRGLNGRATERPYSICPIEMASLAFGDNASILRLLGLYHHLSL